MATLPTYVVDAMRSKRPAEPKTPEPESPDTLWQTWKSDPTPTNAGALLRSTKDWIDQGARTYGDGGAASRSRAKILALQSFGSYDPNRGALKTHIMSDLRRLQRLTAQSNNIISVPEGVSLDWQRLDVQAKNLRDRLGREPTISELSGKTMLSPKRVRYIMQYQQAVPEGATYNDDGDESEGSSLADDLNPREKTWQQAWMDAIADDLDPIDKVLMKHLTGPKKVPGNVLAKRLGLSPGAISQRAAKLQKMLHDLQMYGAQ